MKKRAVVACINNETLVFIAYILNSIEIHGAYSYGIVHEQNRTEPNCT